eukprot:7542398-Alexandrium_andersonii.AAC.1
MSASLVGSEMCIRDRGRPARTPTGPPAKEQGPPEGRAAAGSRPARPGPVSYTHLTLPTICSV